MTEQPPLTPEDGAIIARYLTEMLEGVVCPVCHQPLERKEQIGRSVVGHPCGHRLYQGSARLGTEEREKEHPE
jgi:hypothetical protein